MRMRQIIRASFLKRHVHAEPYAALVLSGGYEEAGDHGRFLVNAGDAIFHDAFEAHLDRFWKQGATVLNLRLAPAGCCATGVGRVADPDLVVRVAESDRSAAANLLLSIAVRRTPQLADWPDELAAILMECPTLKLSEWGEEKGIAPWTISRGFAQVFGVSPEAFRARVRARKAWKAVQGTAAPLAAIAAELGFADQAHMTRSVKELTGLPPQAWRPGANRFKTGGRSAA
jgi:AraC-like DNA-binding protein